MPHRYYGTLISDKGVTTRAGHRFIQAAAQTFAGSVSVDIKDGHVTIMVSEGSGTGGRTLLNAPLADLLATCCLTVENDKQPNSAVADAKRRTG